MVRRLRRDGVERGNIDCALKGACVYPQCTCPEREGVSEAREREVRRKGKRIHRTPAGPYIPRRVRPEGWTPLSDWVLVRTKTRHENYAAMQCRNQDMETWLPRYIEPGKGTPCALFPGYLFVRPGHRWAKLRNTLGVIDIVMMGGEPDFVPKAVLKALRANANKDGIVTLPSQRKPEIGEHVEIKVGAWQGFKGLYDGLSPEGRLKVLFSMFGKTVTLEFRRQSSIEVIIG